MTTDGGYYAIKGFTYQFDKTLLEVFNNPTLDIEIEQAQDIFVDDYYIQVKHKESQDYQPSKVKDAVSLLFNQFIKDKKKKFKLFCYFKDKSVQEVMINVAELDVILGSNKTNYSSIDKDGFVKNFTLEFSSDFEKQFKEVISKIRNDLALTTDEEATVYHALFKSTIMDIAILKDRTKRLINFEKLKDLKIKKEKVIFELAYCKFLSNSKYLAYLKKEYFTFKKVNIPEKERLLIIQVDTLIKDSNLLELITNIKNKYFKKDISPAPYICLYDINPSRLKMLKQSLIDKGLRFFDGTHFNGDKFRISDLIIETHKGSSNVGFKVLDEEFLPFFLKKGKIDEVYVFSTFSKIELKQNIKDLKEFYIQQTKDIIKIIS